MGLPSSIDASMEMHPPYTTNCTFAVAVDEHPAVTDVIDSNLVSAEEVLLQGQEQQFAGGRRHGLHRDVAVISVGCVGADRPVQALGYGMADDLLRLRRGNEGAGVDRELHRCVVESRVVFSWLGT